MMLAREGERQEMGGLSRRSMCCMRKSRSVAWASSIENWIPPSMAGITDRNASANFRPDR